MLTHAVSSLHHMPKPSRLRRIAHMPLPKLLLLLEAAFWLCVARLALLVVPFPRIGRYIGTMQSPSAPDKNPAPEHATLASRVRQAVNATATNAPMELVCLPRALAAWQMLHLRRVPARLHFGAPLKRERDGKPLQTHAWLSCAGVEVTGYPVAHGCVELGFFSRTAANSDESLQDGSRPKSDMLAG